LCILWTNSGILPGQRKRARSEKTLTNKRTKTQWPCLWKEHTEILVISFCRR
jgi:hypothetical protein